MSERPSPVRRAPVYPPTRRVQLHEQAFRRTVPTLQSATTLFSHIEGVVVNTKEKAVSEPGSLRHEAVDRGLAEPQAAAGLAIGQLLQAAHRLIRRDGSIDLPIRDIIEEAGVGTRFFYRHFGSKESFLLILLQDLFDQMAEHVARSVAAASGPRAGVIAWVHGVLDHAEPETASLGRPLLVHGARLNHQFPEAYHAVDHALMRPLTVGVEDGVARGIFHSPNPHADARAIFLLSVSAMQAHVLSGTVTSPEERDHISGFALRALGAENGTTHPAAPR
jgi:AcrR family transcriptional regulator